MEDFYYTCISDPFFVKLSFYFDIVMSIATIVFLVKLWRMTNNVKAIKQQLNNETNAQDVFTLAYCSDKASTKAKLIQIFITQYVDLCNGYANDSATFHKNFEALISKYKAIFKKLDIEFPEELTKLEKSTYLDFSSVYYQ